MSIKVRLIKNPNKNSINVDRKSKEIQQICTSCACIAEDKYQNN